MNKRKLTPEQEIILEYIPDFFNWHEGCRKQVEQLASELVAYKKAFDNTYKGGK